MTRKGQLSGAFTLVLMGLMLLNTVNAVDVSSTVTVGNSAPVVSSVVVNGAADITLIPDSTKPVTVTFTVTDNNGCSDAFTSGSVTIKLFRSGVTASCTPDDRNCYSAAAPDSNTCSTGTAGNATKTFNLQFFAQPTDSGSYAAETWTAAVTATDAASANHSASASQEVNTLRGISVNPTSIGYGTVGSGSNTGSTNQQTTVKNTGNVSTGLAVHANPTLTSGGNTIASTNQHYSTSAFTFGGAESSLQTTQTTVASFTLAAPANTTPVTGIIYWGLNVPAGTVTGAYAGTNVFTAVP